MYVVVGVRLRAVLMSFVMDSGIVEPQRFTFLQYVSVHIFGQLSMVCLASCHQTNLHVTLYTVNSCQLVSFL